MFPDKNNWQWYVSGMNEVKLPPRTKATSSSIEYCSSERLMSAHELYDCVRNAHDDGPWNKEAVLWCLANNSKGSNSTDVFDDQNPEEVQERIKAHDFDTGADIPPIRVITMWVKEYTGKVSQYIFLKTPVGRNEECKKDPMNDAFLYRNVSAYDNMRQAIHVFPYFTGNNGNIHTIRGLGQIVYPQVQASNMMQCSMLDSARDAMTTTYVATEKNIDRLPIIYAGSARLVPPTLQVSEQQHKPDLQRSAMPAMSLLRDQITRMSSAAAMTKVLNEGQDRRSKFEVSAAIEYFSAINAAAMRLFFKPWREMLVESARRAFVKSVKTGTSWGDAAKRMRDRCIARNVPVEVLDDGIDFEEAMVQLPLGLGNKAAREAIFSKGTELLPWMDEAGRRRFAVERAVDLFGVEKADSFVSLQGVERPPIDAKIAQLENNQLVMGQRVFVDPAEDTIVHLREHISFCWQYHQAYESGEAELVDVVQKIKPVYDHAVETFQTAQVPDDQRQEIMQAKQSLQQLDEIISNGLKAIQKMMREQQAQEQQGGQEQGGGQDDKQQAAIIKAQADAQIKLQMAELQRQITLQKAQLDQAIAKSESETKQILALQEAANKRAASTPKGTGVIQRAPQ